MPRRTSRRRFLRQSLIATAAGAAALSFEERALLARTAAERKAERKAEPGAAPPPLAAEAATGAPEVLPAGTIGPLTVTRLICGGNLISGFAHSRDLIYVSPLVKHYFTDEKVCETLELCEENGINTTILRVDEHILRILKKYRSERGGRLQWIAQCKPTEKDLPKDIGIAAENGAVGAYLQGGVADEFVKKGKVELIGTALDLMRKRGLVAGIGGHELATIVACEKAGLAPDFYMKTFHTKEYFTASIPKRNDSVWDETPEETAAFMRTVKRPWIAFKVMAAGAIAPAEAFAHAFKGGADFICAGMFDFQVVEDVIIAKNALAKLSGRERLWLG